MTVLFIGGTGNISTECAALLHERGHSIVVLTRGRASVPQEYRAVKADRQNLGEMRHALSGVHPEIVINFIGYEPMELEVDYELFKGAIQQYIFISSATVYLKPPPSLPITEDHPFGNPFWDYAQKKIACENWLLEHWHNTRFPVTIVRPSHTYSKFWIPNPVSSSSYTFAQRMEQGKPLYIPDDGRNPWTLTAASDFAIGLAGLVGNPRAIGEAFHITGDEVLTWNEIYAEISAALGVSLPRIVPVPTDFICTILPRFTGTLKGDKALPGVFDNSKIKRFVPDFHTRKPFRVGVRESVAWLRAHPEYKNLNPQIEGEIEAVLAAWKEQAQAK